QREGMLADEMASVRAASRQTVAPGEVNLDHLVESQRYEMTLRAQQRLLAQQRKAITGEIERRREAVLAANREVRSLEKLRERHQQRFQQEGARRDLRELDEVASRNTRRGDD
ncbi:MAG: flagellar FliJ family protein, partial [Patescibacteria group bacterium]|nr:flagellar FliJ family protein [Patescibacteria group bacterium]